MTNLDPYLLWMFTSNLAPTAEAVGGFQHWDHFHPFSSMFIHFHSMKTDHDPSKSAHKPTILFHVDHHGPAAGSVRAAAACHLLEASARFRAPETSHPN